MNRLTKTEPISLKKVKGRVSLSPLSFVGASLGFSAVFLEVGMFGTIRNGHIKYFITNYRMKNRINIRKGSFINMEFGQQTSNEQIKINQKISIIKT